MCEKGRGGERNDGGEESEWKGKVDGKEEWWMVREGGGAEGYGERKEEERTVNRSLFLTFSETTACPPDGLKDFKND